MGKSSTENDASSLTSFDKCMLFYSLIQPECVEESFHAHLEILNGCVLCFKLHGFVCAERSCRYIPLVVSTCWDECLDFLKSPFVFPPFGNISLSRACCSFAAFSISSERHNQVTDQIQKVLVSLIRVTQKRKKVPLFKCSALGHLSAFYW